MNIRTNDLVKRSERTPEAAVSDISLVRLLNELVRTPLAGLDAMVSSVIGRLAEGAGAGWACLYRLEGSGLTLTHGWVAAGRAPVECDPVKVLSPVMGRLLANETAALHDGLQGRSALALPINDGTRLTGVLGFVFDADLPALPEAEIERLKAAAEVIETVLARHGEAARHRDTARRLEATLAALPDLLFEVGADGIFAGFSAGPPELMAAPPDRLAGMHLSEALPPDACAVALRGLEMTLRDGRVTGLRYPLAVNGKDHWFELAGARKPAAVPGAEPSVIFLVRDVTDDMQMRDQVSRLGKIVETMSNLVAILDLDERVVWVNAAFETQTGWRLDEIRGKPLTDLVRCDADVAGNAGHVADAMKKRLGYAGQTINQDRWGRRYWIDFHVVPLHDGAGQVNGFVTIETVVTKSKEQEAAMAELARSATVAREQMENALRALPDAVAVLDAEDRLVVANEAYFAMFPELAGVAVVGATTEEILREGVARGIFGPGRGADAAAREAWVQDRLQTYRAARDVDEVQLPDGRWMRRMHMRTADGGCIAASIDITARQNQIAALDAANRDLSAALEERDRAERHLLGIIDGAEVGTFELDLVTNELRVGGHWAEMLGRDPEADNVFEFIDFHELVHPEDRPRIPLPASGLPDPGDGFIELEFRMLHDDGHWVWILSRSRVTARDAAGNPLAVAGVHLDISDRKRLEQEIRASRAYLSEVMDTSIAALAVLDEAGRITYANLEAERILGLSRSEMRGKAYNDPSWRLERVEGGPLPDGDLPFRRALEEQGTVRNMRFALHWPDGERRVLSANAVPLAHVDGNRQVVVSFSDITEEIAATARLEEARARAEGMSRAKSVFLANMSHEIRTPLNGVLGMAEVLDSVVTPPEQKQMVATIRRSGETLLTVLNSILDMSKIEAGKMELETVPLRVSEIVAQAEAVFSVQAEEKGLEFEVMSHAGADRARLGDPHRIAQVLNNLLSNAIKFTESGGVELKVSSKPGKPVTFEVSDSGVGMTPEQVERVFDSFEQADGSTTRRFGGTGLGLSIVRELVELMGGTVEMSSAQGRGTRVKVTLPLAEAPEGPHAPELVEQVPDMTVLEGRNVLVADDNLTNRIVLSEMLTQTGVQITMVENGQDAIAAWKKAGGAGRGFDLLLLDITMPVLDGMSALSEIRRAECATGAPPVPAIAVTANAMPNQVADYIMGGFDTHLAKPFKRKDLLHAIRSLLRG
ncbi:PAS domain S-box protein [Paragemmobacter straminiformis]|uniref:histidine kinase n=1 Tax=Paragemmobacter straminiformis TaxID=2045119 RepID=A0A842I998_9RHOB|nr:PAS domain S-box protein [Gemmobacter straminiformis]MBC2835993.1 PAS domain S-box protein [Gemmobacter straminiformis]